MSHLSTITSLRARFQEELSAGTSLAELHQKYLGRKGELTQVLREIGALAEEERRSVSQPANALKAEIAAITVAAKESVAESSSIDSGVPAMPYRPGSIHPISAIIGEMTGIFRELSFEVVEGNELITETENFESLNMGPDHPSRDGHETFYIEGAAGTVLRTQTTAVQVLEMTRRMKKNHLPIRVVIPGKTYRRESDATHSPMFHQMDAVMVDSQTTFSDLRGALDYFAKRLFGDLVETRFRPHNFPFTEPSAEMDIRWKGATSGAGKHTGWLEFGGCGMIHPDVLKRAGINPRIYQGWAFGMSVERPLMLRHQIPDLRRLYDNSSQFLNQFSDQL